MCSATFKSDTPLHNITQYANKVPVSESRLYHKNLGVLVPSSSCYILRHSVIPYHVLLLPNNDLLRLSDGTIYFAYNLV
jgi:hypothetical protein